VIQEDVTKGRLRVYQHAEDPKFYVDAEDFIDYAAGRVPELKPDQQRTFWLAVKKIVINPDAPVQLSPAELAAVIAGIDRELERCGGS
jgi:hypothetical protein